MKISKFSANVHVNLVKCCRDTGVVGHHVADHSWLCFVGGCCNQRRRLETLDVYVVNAGPVFIPSSVVIDQPPSNKNVCKGAVTSQPIKL